MKTETVKIATSLKDGTKRTTSFEKEFPENIQEAISTLGEVPVFVEFLAGYVITIQNAARRVLANPDLQPEDYESAVGNFMSTWKLGDKAPRATRTAQNTMKEFAAFWSTLTPEKRQEMVAQYGLSVPEEFIHMNGPSTPTNEAVTDYPVEDMGSEAPESESPYAAPSEESSTPRRRGR